MPNKWVTLTVEESLVSQKARQIPSKASTMSFSKVRSRVKCSSRHWYLLSYCMIELKRSCCLELGGDMIEGVHTGGVMLKMCSVHAAAAFCRSASSHETYCGTERMQRHQSSVSTRQK